MIEGIADPRPTIPLNVDMSSGNDRGYKESGNPRQNSRYDFSGSEEVILGSDVLARIGYAESLSRVSPGYNSRAQVLDAYGSVTGNGLDLAA